MCTAISKTRTRHAGQTVLCTKAAIRGGTVCPTHGGSRESVKRRAMERLEAASESAANTLVELSKQRGDLRVARAAANDILNRSHGAVGSADDKSATQKPSMIFGFIVTTEMKDKGQLPTIDAMATIDATVIKDPSANS